MKTIPEETLTRIREHLKTLKLVGMQKVLEKELSEAAERSLPPMEVLERLLAVEANALIERRIERRIKESRLPTGSSLPILTLPSRPASTRPR